MVSWIKIATTIFDDEKILLIESMPDADALIVIWLKMLVLAGKCNKDGVLMMNDTIPYTDEMLASIFRRPLNTVRLAIDTFVRFGMVEIINDCLLIPNWEKHQNIDGLDKIREQTRQRVSRHREKQKQLCNVTRNVTVTECNAIEQDTDTDKDIDIENGCCYTRIWQNLKPDEIDQLYEMYENAGELIDEVHAEVKRKRRIVKNPYAYIIGYADKKGWIHGRNQQM